MSIVPSVVAPNEPKPKCFVSLFSLPVWPGAEADPRAPLRQVLPVQLETAD
jgi:hypothetical protein